MAKEHDRRTRRAAPTSITPGDHVRILLPKTGHKLAQSYSEPRLVTKVRGNTVWLSNGGAWNVRRCLLESTLSRPPTTPTHRPTTPNNNDNDLTSDSDQDDEQPTFPFPLTPPPTLRRSNRVRRPRDLSSFVTY
jgi:hypothetical protein